MAAPLAAAALVSGLNMLLLQGSKAVVKKYGKNGLKEIAKYGKKQTEIAKIAEKNRTLKATEKGKSSAERALKEDRLVKESRGRASNTRKSKSRNERLEEEAGPRFDPDTGGYEMLDDVPLQFAKGGLLDRDKYIGGGKVPKGKTKAEIKEEKRIEKLDRKKEESQKRYDKNKEKEEVRANRRTEKSNKNAEFSKSKSEAKEYVMKLAEEYMDGTKTFGQFTDKYGSVPELEENYIRENYPEVYERQTFKGALKEFGSLLSPSERDKKMSGGQAKLDVDKDGELTAKDFEALRERTQKQMGGMMAGMLIGNEEEMQEPMAEKTVSEEMQEELEPLPEEPMEEPMMSEESQMDSDDEMEDNYLDFVINQALSEEEEEMLMNELESNPDLSLLFDKVMDVAQEFSGAGPVEGPGSEVSDSIPARLSDGEFVITAKATEEIGADTLMSMMKEAEAKADERQELAYGGTVTTTVRQEEDDYDFGANPEEQELRNAAVSEQMRNLNPRLR